MLFSSIASASYRVHACAMSERVFEVYQRYMANALQNMTGVDYSAMQHQRVRE